MPHTTKSLLILAAALTSSLLASCGILNPFAFPSAVIQNSNFTFKGHVADTQGIALSGVVVHLANSHHLWTPLAGSRDVDEPLTRRVDDKFLFETRGSYTEFTFSKDGYYDAYYRIQASTPNEVITNDGIWPNADNFPVVMPNNRIASANLAHLNTNINYSAYPLADCISVLNLAADAATGDTIFHGKDSEDPTVFPDGTLYVTLDKSPPPAINAKGDIDLADLDIPDHVTLHLPGKNAGLLRIEPRVGFHPIYTSDTAPPEGYARDLNITRARLKEMRQANNDNIIGAHEYFFLHAGPYFGKAVFSWASRSGQPVFHLDLYIDREPSNRDLTLHKAPN